MYPIHRAIVTNFFRSGMNGAEDGLQMRERGWLKSHRFRGRAAAASLKIRFLWNLFAGKSYIPKLIYVASF